MPSSPDWNRKLHYYLGLYLLLFLLLFSFTGLLLNHPMWRFAEFWPQRQQSSYVQAIHTPPAGADLDQARELMRQLDVRGEIEWTQTRQRPASFAFRVTRPGHILDINADLEARRASVQRIDLNGWGVARLLHSFTGVRAADSRNQRDWILTSALVFCMDALAVGVVLMALSGLWMWWAQATRRRGGVVALGAGLAACGFFAAGLRWLF
jgi:hypothetical protein